MKAEQFEKIMNKIDVLIKLSALNVLKDMPVKEKVKTLDGLGLKPIQIARVIDRSRNQVYVTLHDIRKEEKPKKNQSLIQ